MKMFEKALRAAVSVGIAPSEFWALSPKEWRAIFVNIDGLRRADFQELERIFGEKNE